ncbi:MAG: hypothetical protein ACRDRE_09965 [Pseudonocardiaceae bacterium]
MRSTHVLARLRERAADHGISLSAHVRELLAEEAAQQTLPEMIARISLRTPVDVSDEEICGVIHDGRR